MEKGAARRPTAASPMPSVEPDVARERSNGSTAGTRGAGVVPAKVRAPRLRWMPRERLDQQLGQLWQQRLCLVIAPPGSGKTTTLAGWAASMDCPVAWYRAESADGAEEMLVACLEEAFATALPGIDRGWTSVEQAAAVLDGRPEERVLLVIDDLHTLLGTPAEAALERFIEYAPPSVAVVAGTRTPPAFNLPRRRVSGELLELSADDLRFRSWEVERLFRDFYDDALRPDELARITRRTEGWAAGLQLFHLATRGKAPDERVRIMAGLGSSSRFVREYLARNVVAELPEELRAFLVGTSVLRRLSGPLCDALLERQGSRALLEELERRCVFTVATDDEGNFRYHEVLRSHLETMLVEAVGEARARMLARRAGGLLEAAGAITEALAAYSRAEDWAAVDRLIDEHGERLVMGDGAWIDTLPPALLVQDPWLILATARRHRAEGRWAQAVDAYARAEALFPSGQGAAACHHERLSLAAWLDPLPAPGTDWTGQLRAAVARDPLARRGGSAASVVVPSAGRAEPSAAEYLGSGLAALVAGRVRDARDLLREAATSTDAGPTVAAAAGIGGGIAGVLAGDTRAVMELEAAVAAAERAGAGWLARIGRAVQAVATSPSTTQVGRAEAAAVRASAARDDDRWGEGLAALAEGWASLGDPTTAEPPLEIAAARFRALGAATLEAWARSLLAGSLARSGADGALEVAASAEAVARSAGAPGPHALAQLALAMANPAQAPELQRLADTLLAEIGLGVPAGLGQPATAEGGPTAAGSPGMTDAARVSGSGGWNGTRPAGPPRINGAAHGPANGAPNGAANRILNGAANGAGNGLHGASQVDVGPPVTIICFGAFRMSVDGLPVDLGALKPRPRAVLRLLALHAGRPVHREVLQESLWPESDAETGARSLHVALSQLRRELDPGGERAAAGGPGVLVREGDAYRIALAAGSSIDVLVFDASVAEGRAARTRGDAGGAIAAFRMALAAYGGDLLPEDGPADWVVPRRERARADCVDVARALAELLVDNAPAEAAAVCTAGLAIDAYHDPLWRLLIAARERSGDVAAATSARAGYARMLAELGVSVSAVQLA